MTKALQVFANKEDKIVTTIIDTPLMDYIDGSFFDRLDYVEQELVIGDPEEFSILVAKNSLSDYTYVAFLMHVEELGIESDIDYQVIVLDDNEDLLAFLEVFTPFINVPFDVAWQHNGDTYGEQLVKVINRYLLTV